MTKDEIIRMAREAGFVFPETQEDSFTCWWEELERFAALVAANEREKLAGQEPTAWMYEGDKYFDGNTYRFDWKYTGSKELAEFRSGTIKKPIPLYTAPQP